MYWANFLHIYQPPTQKSYWVRRVAEESYRKIFQGLLAAPQAKVTININGVLLELLEQNGCMDVVDNMRELVGRGQLELTGSAKYHAMLPFLPEDEIIRQIQLNEQTLKKYFGPGLLLKGFFPPEMAFSFDVAKTAAKLGYSWIIADELSFAQGRKPAYDRVYEIEGLDKMAIFLRERRMSWVILSGQVGTGALLVGSLGERLNSGEYLLTAMDGETFGHHRPGLEQLLFEIYNNPKLATAHISDLLEHFPQREKIKPLPSTWALMEKDLETSKPFSRWQDPDNEIHNLQWELTYLAISMVGGAEQQHPDYLKARALLDRALHSDQYWWASARPWWSIEMIERGAKELYDAIVITPGVSEEVKENAKHLYHTLIFIAFDWQRSGKVDQLAHQEDEDIRQRTDIGLPKLPREEVEKMISHLQSEMQLVAERQEFERAAQIRDRIAELRRYISDTAQPEPSLEGDREFELKA